MSEMTAAPIAIEDALSGKAKRQVKEQPLVQPAMRFTAPRGDGDIREQMRGRTVRLDTSVAGGHQWPVRDAADPKSFLGPAKLRLRPQTQMEGLEQTLNGRFCPDFEDFEKQPLPSAKQPPVPN